MRKSLKLCRERESMWNKKTFDSKWPIESIKIRIKSAIYPLLKSLKKIEKRRKIAFALFVDFFCVWWIIDEMFCGINLSRSLSFLISLIYSVLCRWFRWFRPLKSNICDEVIACVWEHSSLNIAYERALNTSQLCAH